MDFVVFYVGRTLNKDKKTKKSWVCFGNMFLKLEKGQTKDMLDKGIQRIPSYCLLHVMSNLSGETGPRGYKTFSMLNSVEHEIFLLINVKMPTVVGILTSMSRKNSILSLSELEKG